MTGAVTTALPRPFGPPVFPAAVWHRKGDKSEMMCRIYTHTASGQTPAHANHRADGTSTGDKQNRSKPTTAIDKWLSRNTLAGA